MTMKTAHTSSTRNAGAAPQTTLIGGAVRTRASRRRVIAIAIGVQALLLAAGWVVTFRAVRERVSEKFKDQIVASNTKTVEAVREKLAELVPHGMAYGDQNWEVAQSVIESIKMPADGFACIIDDEGRLLCHPDMREDPSLRGVNLGEATLKQEGTASGTPLARLTGDGVVAGSVTFMGVDKHYLATAMVPGMNARLLVHQPVAGLISAGEAATGGLLWISLGIGSIVLLSTGFATVGLMRRHDRDLEGINTRLEAEVARRLDQAMSTRDALILGLAKLADYRDTDTGTHLERIAEYSELLARELAKADATIDEAYIRRLRVASSMHDIGKVGVEDAVLLKPGKLTDAERSRMQRHPIMGADTLIAIREKMGHDELVEMALVVTLEHHERWDGTGYPLGLAGEQIQLPARIVALADVYDALTSKRVYKDAMTHEAAAAVIVQGRGTQFDAMVVDAFLACGAGFAHARAKLQPPESKPGGTTLAA
jgi:HD-GYP domain-containing protein (c-di-GMP phosphodiesterase class II)